MKVECSSLRTLSITDSKLVGKMNCLFQSHKYQSTVKKRRFVYYGKSAALVN